VPCITNGVYVINSEKLLCWKKFPRPSLEMMHGLKKTCQKEVHDKPRALTNNLDNKQSLQCCPRTVTMRNHLKTFFDLGPPVRIIRHLRGRAKAALFQQRLRHRHSERARMQTRLRDTSDVAHQSSARPTSDLGCCSREPEHRCTTRLLTQCRCGKANQPSVFVQLLTALHVAPSDTGCCLPMLSEIDRQLSRAD